MQSPKVSNYLRRVYYVAVGGMGLIPVPAERMIELRQLKSEHHQRQVEVGMALSGVRRT